METAQLSYFILACQFRNQAEAAAYSRISASVLSENIDALERELGLVLFQRGPQGQYPTEAARWLYQSVEPLLQAVDAAESMFAGGNQQPVRYLDVTSPLQFMAGHLSRVTSLATRALMNSSPGVVARVRFALGRPPYVHALDHYTDHRLVPPQGERSHVLIDYADDVHRPDGTVVFHDPWVALTASPQRRSDTGRLVTVEDLRHTQLYVPPLGEAQITQIGTYCKQFQLPDPVIIEEDVGTFERLSREKQPFHLLAPKSLVAPSAARSSLHTLDLPVDLISVVIARFAADDHLAADYVRHICKAVESNAPVVMYKPKITMKQLRYFLSALEHLNVTAAARHLHVAQPALSSQLRKLETTVGSRLFERSHSGIIALDTALALAALIRPAMDACEGIAAAVAHYNAGRKERLTIGIIPASDHDGPMAQGVAIAIDEWSRLHPKIKLRIMEGNTETLRRWVESGEVGFALVEAQVSRSWQIDLEAEDVLGVVSSAQRPLLAKGSVSLRDALKLPLALPGAAFGLRQLLDRAASDVGDRVSAEIEVNTLPILLALVKRLKVATILPSSAIKPQVVRKELQFNPISDPVITRRLSILFSADRNLSDVERDLVALLRRELASAVSGS